MNREREKLALTVDDVAAALQLNPQTVSRWFRNGKLPGRKIGREWRISRKALEDFIEGKTDDDRR
jgi:excisionase family DNA binding protein